MYALDKAEYKYSALSKDLQIRNVYTKTNYLLRYENNI